MSAAYERALIAYGRNLVLHQITAWPVAFSHAYSQYAPANLGEQLYNQ
jgi:hypothetical protein